MGLNFKQMIPFHHEHAATTISPSTMVGITPEGKKALDNMQLQPQEFPIMLALDSSGTMSLSNISREARISVPTADLQVKRLCRQGYVAVKNFEEERG